MPKIMKEEYQSVKKIKEASFFLNQLRENYNNLKTFDHFLNAFLSSARSITWIMKKDFSNNENWKKWYAQIEYNSEVEKIFNKITKLRNESQKERTVNSSLVATVNIPMKDVPPDKLDKLMGKIINADFKNQIIMGKLR